MVNVPESIYEAWQLCAQDRGVDERWKCLVACESGLILLVLLCLLVWLWWLHVEVFSPPLRRRVHELAGWDMDLEEANDR